MLDGLGPRLLACSMFPGFSVRDEVHGYATVGLVG